MEHLQDGKVTLTGTQRPNARKLPVRPSSPVPWVIIGVGAVWAWQPGKGLIKLPDGVLARGAAEMWSLSGDGTTLRWRTPVHARQRLMCHLRLISGAVVLTEAPEPVGEDFYGANGAVCEVRYADLAPNGIWQHAEYSVRQEGKWKQLPLRDRLRTQPTSPGVQFSLAGDHVAVTVIMEDGLTTAVDVIDLMAGTAQRFVRMELQGSGAWSPDGQRLLVEEYDEGFHGYRRAVLDLRSASTNLITAAPDQPIQVSDLQLVGWITDQQLLGYRLHNRRLSLWTVDIADGSIIEIVEMRSPASLLDMNCLLMAPSLVQATPHLLHRP